MMGEHHHSNYTTKQYATKQQYLVNNKKIYAFTSHQQRFTLSSHFQVSNLCSFYRIFQTDLLSAEVLTLHSLERTEEAARWLFNQVLVYFLGSNLEVGGPLILIIIKFDMFEISRTALLSELILLIRLKFLSHSAALTGNFFIQFMSGFRFLGSLLGSSSRSCIPFSAWSVHKLNHLHSCLMCSSPWRMLGFDGHLL